MGPKKREIPARCTANSAMVEKRIRDKLLDYERYAFDVRKSRALTIFFDLSQEFQSRDNFYAALIQILRMMFDLDAALYVMEDEETFVLASCSQDYALKPEITRTWEEGKSTRRTFSEGRLYLPIRCNPEFNDMLPFMPPDNVIGMLVVRLEDMEDEDLLLFLEKYANRIGFQLHNRILRDRSREHLDFIRNLVEDIGHNVIVPNIYFKLYFNRLRRLIESLGDLKKKAERSEDENCSALAGNMGKLHEAMHEQYEEIYRHYVQTSMFLETLLRRRHFEEGRYVLEKRPCNLMRQVIEPQLERYRNRLEERGIQLDFSLGGVPDQAIRMIVDVGLLSQVYANLFSNAVKYTGKTTLPDGREGRFLSYGWKVIKDHFGKGRSGIHMWVFTSGDPLELDDPMTLFDPGYRAENTNGEHGTGHGLYFVRQVVELHRGDVGVKTCPYGNEINFTLPFQVQA